MIHHLGLPFLKILGVCGGQWVGNQVVGLQKVFAATYLCILDCRNTQILYNSKTQQVSQVFRASFCTACKCSRSLALAHFPRPISLCTLFRRAYGCLFRRRQSHKSYPEKVFFDTVSKEASLCNLLCWWRRKELNLRPQRFKERCALPLLSYAPTVILALTRLMPGRKER